MEPDRSRQDRTVGSDLVNRYEYHIDFPGDPLDAGCDYERWARRLTDGSSPTVYAHVATDAGYPGKLALQYWFFYPFNDFNNTHEGDWEMTQLVFDASDARQALTKTPVEVGYSSHEGAERAAWGDEKLELVDERTLSSIRRRGRMRTSSRPRCTSEARPTQASAVTTPSAPIAS